MKKYTIIATIIIVCLMIIFSKINVKCNDTEDVSATREYKISAITPYEVAIHKIQTELKNINNIRDKEQWFIAYKNLVLKYRDLVDSNPTIYDCYTEEEIYLIQRVVETECYDQDFISKVNVASVVMNRIEIGGEFGNTIEEVITKENQFAYWRKDITESTVLAVEYAFQIGDTTNGCVAFRSDKSPETWGKWEYVFEDEAGHSFYREKEKLISAN